MEAALQVIREEGPEGLRLRTLADRLHVKAPSLYNHYADLQEIWLAVAAQVQGLLAEEIATAVDGLTGDAALAAFAKAQLRFSRREPRLYQVLLRLPSLGTDAADALGEQSVAPLLQILDQYHLSQADRIHVERMIRSFLHGFFSLSQAGYLAHRQYTTDESFAAALDYFLCLLHDLEKRGEGTGHAAYQG